eukprot:15432519-Alexandrium_andersonii.AAC.1
MLPDLHCRPPCARRVALSLTTCRCRGCTLAARLPHRCSCGMTWQLVVQEVLLTEAGTAGAVRFAGSTLRRMYMDGLSGPERLA